MIPPRVKHKVGDVVRLQNRYVQRHDTIEDLTIVKVDFPNQGVCFENKRGRRFWIHETSLINIKDWRPTKYFIEYGAL